MLKKKNLWRKAHLRQLPVLQLPNKSLSNQLLWTVIEAFYLNR